MQWFRLGGSNLGRPKPFYLHVPPPCLPASSHSPKNMHASLTGNSDLSLGVNVSEWLFVSVCPAMGRRVSRVDG